MVVLRGIRRTYKCENDVVYFEEEACDEIAIFTSKEKLDAFVKNCRKLQPTKLEPFKKGTLLEKYQSIEISNIIYGMLPIDPA